ncbi:MAG: glycosyltransferase family 1 protein [Rikenellaceae bacterium]
MITVDCRKLKHPNTGLYTFCRELILALERAKGDAELCYLFNSKGYKNFTADGSRVEHYKISKLWDRLPIFGNRGLFHSTVQMASAPICGKRVLTIHDLNFLYEKSEAKAARYIKRLQREVRGVDYIVAISEFTKSEIMRHVDIGDTPIEVIYNGCSLFDGEPTEQPKYRPAGKFLFSMGTILRKKNFHVLPSILVGNDYELIVAGNDSPYSQEIVDEARRYGVEERVHLIGSISEAEKDWYFRNMTAFLFPSIAEGFGLPVIEAMSYGKPTIISTYTSLPEVGADHCYYLPRDFNPTEMQEILKHALESFTPERAKAEIRHAKSFSWDRAAASYLDIYNRL